MCFKITTFFLYFISFTINAQDALKSVNTNSNTSSSVSDFKLSFKIIKANNNTFGYNIFSDNQLLIHQTTIPGLPGNEGFKTKDAAEAVAKLVISKIEKNEMPPSISIEEMKKLKVIP